MEEINLGFEMVRKMEKIENDMEKLWEIEIEKIDKDLIENIIENLKILDKLIKQYKEGV
ncbi:hypothetical protein [Clostridium sporogenes]|uniref:hypothetical protein n=1 Tax=Clostridium sporogenes TaxID=1509 RepID=UPI00156232AE|nr:hypothetical protein [Clostridium sporogenes]UBI13437.1 hypothetical protein LA336_07900 [Clostridium sporogenes]